jgi:hypothetical protein
MKLNLGCGRDVREGWVNVDSYPYPGVHRVNLDSGNMRQIVKGLGQAMAKEHQSLGGKLNADEMLLSHVLEHIENPLPMLEAMWQVAAPGATLTVRCPHGASDDADEDPTHVRRLFPGSFGYFGQPFYHRADYGYRGDWQTDRIVLFMDEQLRTRFNDDLAVINQALRNGRNMVLEMVTELHAVKPPREPKAELQVPPEMIIEWV